jgi:hypothetical protein
MLKYLELAINLDSVWKDKAKKDKDFRQYWDDADFKHLVE